MPTMYLNCAVPTEVSDEDFLFLSGLSFNQDQKGYLMCSSRGEYKGKRVHQIVRERMGISANLLTDHKDRDKLNNKRDNFRAATNSQNGANSSIHGNNTSGYKGVSWHKHQQKWRVRICVNRKDIALGYYDDIEEARQVYIRAAKEYFGEFAHGG